MGAIKKLLVAGGLLALLLSQFSDKREYATSANGYSCRRSPRGTITEIQKGEQRIMMERFDGDNAYIQYPITMSESEVTRAIEGCDKAFDQKYQNETGN